MSNELNIPSRETNAHTSKLLQSVVDLKFSYNLENTAPQDPNLHIALGFNLDVSISLQSGLYEGIFSKKG